MTLTSPLGRGFLPLRFCGSGLMSVTEVLLVWSDWEEEEAIMTFKRSSMRFFFLFLLWWRDDAALIRWRFKRFKGRVESPLIKFFFGWFAFFTFCCCCCFCLILLLVDDLNIRIVLCVLIFELRFPFLAIRPPLELLFEIYGVLMPPCQCYERADHRFCCGWSLWSLDQKFLVSGDFPHRKGWSRSLDIYKHIDI